MINKIFKITLLYIISFNTFSKGIDYPNSIFLDMYTVHADTLLIGRGYDYYNFHNRLKGFSYKNYGFGFFKNTYYKNTYGVFYNKFFRQLNICNFDIYLGYRLGFMFSPESIELNQLPYNFIFVPMPNLIVYTSLNKYLGAEIDVSPYTLSAIISFNMQKWIS